MSRKMFYTKKRRLPKSLQLYIIWALIIIIILPISIFFTSTHINDIKVNSKKIVIYKKTNVTESIFKNQKIPHTVYLQLKKFIPYFYWNKNETLLSQKMLSNKCYIVNYRLQKKSKKNIDFVFNIGKIKNNNKHLLKTILAISETIKKVPLNYNLNFSFINDADKCKGYIAKNISVGVYFSNHLHNNNSFIINYSNSKTLSIFWKKILSKFSPSFIEQIMISASPNSFIRQLKNIFKNKQILTKTSQFNFNDDYNLILKTIQELNTIDTSALEKESFWFSNSSIGFTTYNIYIILLFITMLFPIFNRLAQNKKFDLVSAVISTLYFSLPAFFLFFLMKLADIFSISSTWYSFFMIIVFFILVLLFRFIENKKLSFSVNIVSSLLIVDIFLFFLIFYNSAILILFFLIIIFYSKIKYSNKFIASIMFLLGSIPLILFFNYFMNTNYFIDWLNSQEIYTQFELSTLVFYSFFIGSILSLIKNEEILK